MPHSPLLGKHISFQLLLSFSEKRIWQKIPIYIQRWYWVIYQFLIDIAQYFTYEYYQFLLTVYILNFLYYSWIWLCPSFPFLLSTDIFEEDIFTQKKISLSPFFFFLGSGSNNSSFYRILSLFLLSELFLLILQ